MKARITGEVKNVSEPLIYKCKDGEFVYRILQMHEEDGTLIVGNVWGEKDIPPNGAHITADIEFSSAKNPKYDNKFYHKVNIRKIYETNYNRLSGHEEVGDFGNPVPYFGGGLAD